MHDYLLDKSEKKEQRYRKKRTPTMTVALGFNCPDGIVLCTDSLESDGATKVLVNKIWAYETQDNWGIAVASAGESDFAESFTENLKLLFTGEVYERDQIMLSLRQAINAARTTYPSLDWEALFALYGPTPLDRQLLRLSHKSKHLAPVRRFESVGCGSQIAKFVCSQMYTVFANVDEAAELGIYAIMRCCEYVDGCGGPISVLTYKIENPGWRPYLPEDVTAIEAKFGKDKLRDNLLDFWIAQTPQVQRLQPLYRHLRTGGFINYVRAAATKNTFIAKPLVTRKSKRSVRNV